MNIYRCVCYDQTFEDLKVIAQRERFIKLPQLQKYCEFGNKCQLCHPYIKEMLRTGQTQFHRIIQDQADHTSI